MATILTLILCILALFPILATWNKSSSLFRLHMLPAWIVGIDMVLVPLTTISGQNLYAVDIVTLGALIALISRKGLSRLSSVFSKTGAPALAFIAVCITSAVLTRYSSALAFAGTLQRTQFLAVILVAAVAIANMEELFSCLRLLVSLVGVNAMIALGQAGGIVPIPALALDQGIGGIGRVSGLSGNSLAQYLVLGLGCTLLLYLVDARKNSHIAILSALQVAALALTGVRVALIGLAVFVLVVVVVRATVARSESDAGRVRRMLMVLVGAGLIVAPIVATASSFDSYRSRLGGITTVGTFEIGSTSYVRLELWRIALRIGSDNFWVGSGPKSWIEARFQSGLPSQIAGISTTGLNDPHHVLLEVFASLGILGLLSYAWLFVRCGGLAVRTARNVTDRDEANRFRTMGAVIIAILGVELVGTEFGSPLAVAAVLGAVLGASTSRRGSNGNSLRTARTRRRGCSELERIIGHHRVPPLSRGV